MDGHLVELRPRRGRAAQARGVYDLACAPRCHLVWNDPAPLAVGDARAEYFAWRAALASLAAGLAGQLTSFEPTPPAAPAMPWILDDEIVTRVLSDGLPPGLLGEKLRLQPQRPAAGPPVESSIEREARRGEVNYRAAVRAKRLAARA